MSFYQIAKRIVQVTHSQVTKSNLSLHILNPSSNSEAHLHTILFTQWQITQSRLNKPDVNIYRFWLHCF